ncbi:MAG: MgtC/SapB family protein [Lachnospiraceae bacterium]|nr:MgtC/SapB family protein [Lachnospiraceae bacterium]
MGYTEYICRIVVSLLLGFFIGLERQLTGHQAGIRINVLICIGTSFFTLFPMLYGSTEIFRMASSIVTGVGFLCSGVIFKDGPTVRGINTAATLWCTAAIGVLASTGKYAFSISATAILILSNLLLRPLAIHIHPVFEREEEEKRYRISITCTETVEMEVRATLVNGSVCKTLCLQNLESGDIVGEKVEIFADYISYGKAKNAALESIVRKISENAAVLGAGWEIL